MTPQKRADRKMRLKLERLIRKARIANMPGSTLQLSEADKRLLQAVAEVRSDIVPILPERVARAPQTAWRSGYMGGHEGDSFELEGGVRG